jgi:RNA polymerase sigma-70 factor, ECF subfamily
LDNDSRLIARAQRGDTLAYASLVRQYEQLAFRAAYLITRDEHEAADAAQDAFLRAYRALKSFKTDQPFRPWLLRIVTNQALNRLKSAQRRTRLTGRLTQEMMANQDAPSTERVAEEREQNERLLQAVRRLDANEQTLIALRYFLELSESEVAQTLGVPLGTVKSRLHRTLARLREIITRDFPDLQEAGLTQ